MTTHTPRYGRMLSDFAVGATYAHPWDVTIDGGTIALFQASFQDASPTYASRAYAQSLGHLKLPLTEALHREVVSLPVSPVMTDDQVAYVISVVNA